MVYSALYLEFDMKSASQHVFKTGGGKWAVRETGKARASHFFGSKAEALAVGERIAKAKLASVYLYGPDGRIAERRSFSDTRVTRGDVKA
jgi:hypothetical protein